MSRQQHKALKIIKNNNIVKLEQSAINYYDSAIDKADEEDYLKSLYYIRKSIKADPTMIDNYFLLAEIYYEMGLYERSNNQYFKLLAYGVSTADCYLRIAQNYICMGDIATARSYLKQSLNNSLDDEEMEEAADILDFIESEKPGLRIVDPDSAHGKTIEASRELIAQGQFTKALELLNTIPPKSKHYVEALNNIAVCYSCLDRHHDCLEVSRKAYELEPKNVFTLCNLISAYTYYRDGEALEEMCRKLDGISSSEPSDLFKIALANLECGRLEHAIKALDRYLDIYPYNEVGIFLKGLAYHNMGNITAAKQCMVDLITIDESNTVAKYYNKLMSAPDYKPQPLDYTQNVPPAETMERLKQLSEFAGLSSSVARVMVEQNQNDILNIIKWSFKIPSHDLHQKVIQKLGGCKSDAAEDFLQECLLDTGTTELLKRLILAELIKVEPTQPVLLLTEDKVKEIKFRAPHAVVSSTRVFFEAFVDVFAALSLYAEGFEAGLNKTAKSILAALGEEVHAVRSKNAMAALIAYSLEEMRIFNNLDIICSVFGAAKSTVNKYLKLVKNKNVN